jgi:hypothetical protein
MPKKLYQINASIVIKEDYLYPNDFILLDDKYTAKYCVLSINSENPKLYQITSLDAMEDQKPHVGRAIIFASACASEYSGTLITDKRKTQNHGKHF